MADMTNAQVALLAAATAREWAPVESWNYHMLTRAEQFLKWLEEQDAKVLD